MSPAQNALMELKLAAIAHLSYEDFLCVLGETEDTNSRRYIYRTGTKFLLEELHRAYYSNSNSQKVHI